MTTPQSCLVCGSFEATLLYEIDRGGTPEQVDFGSSRRSAGVLRLMRCKSCGLAWQDPIPSRKSLHDAYTKMRDERYLREQAGRRRSCDRCLRLLSRHARGKTGRLLDVGCSVGIFIEVAAEAGWSVFGLEPSVWLSRRAQESFGARVLACPLENAPFASQCFDAVTLWDVLEHVENPSTAIERAASLLRAGGVLALNVPNLESSIAKVMGAKWPLLLPEHIYYFSPKTLRLLLEGHGFSVRGFHSHLVFFSARYILHRLAQHDIAMAPALERMLGRSNLKDFMMPLFMGETTVFATAPGPGH